MLHSLNKIKFNVGYYVKQLKGYNRTVLDYLNDSIKKRNGIYMIRINITFNNPLEIMERTVIDWIGCRK